MELSRRESSPIPVGRQLDTGVSRGRREIYSGLNKVQQEGSGRCTDFKLQSTNLDSGILVLSGHSCNQLVTEKAPSAQRIPDRKFPIQCQLRNPKRDFIRLPEIVELKLPSFCLIWPTPDEYSPGGYRIRLKPVRHAVRRMHITRKSVAPTAMDPCVQSVCRLRRSSRSPAEIVSIVMTRVRPLREVSRNGSASDLEG